jgi:hypothetical protein
VLIPVFKDGVKWWAVLNMGMDFLIQQKSGRFLVNWATVLFCRKTVGHCKEPCETLLLPNCLSNWVNALL